MAAHEPRGTTSPLTAAATPDGAAVSSATACVTVLPSGRLARLAVELDLHAHRAPFPARKRPGPNGSHSAAGARPVRQATTASAVAADIKMPLR